MCSGGDSTAKAQEKAQAAFTDTLRSSFSTAFGKSQSILDTLTKTLTDAINNPKGFDPRTLALMKSNASDQVAAGTRNAQVAAGNAMAARGGSELGSGVNAQIAGSIAGSGEAERARELSGIDIQSGLLQNENYWRGIQGLTGVAQAENPTGLASAANEGAGKVADLSHAVLASQQAGWQNAMGIVSGIAGLGTAAVGAYTGLGFGGSKAGAGGGGV